MSLLSDTAAYAMPAEHMRSFDRVLKLEPFEGMKAKDTLGLVDTRLFSGGQELHLTMDIQSNLWSFRYSNNGILPQILQGTFTSFTKGYEQAKMYYEKRNVRITEIKD